jgi:hypothetical protein
MLPSIARFPPCRSHDLFWPLEQYPALLRRNPADEAYWFKWTSAVSGAATIRVARIGNEAIATWLYRSSHFGKGRCQSARLGLSDWARLEDSVVAASFWMLDESGGLHGLDGADWLIAGRRRQDFHLIKRCSPKGALYDLGRLLFDLTGLNDVRP